MQIVAPPHPCPGVERSAAEQAYPTDFPKPTCHAPPGTYDSPPKSPVGNWIGPASLDGPHPEPRRAGNGCNERVIRIQQIDDAEILAQNAVQQQLRFAAEGLP